MNGESNGNKVVRLTKITKRASKMSTKAVSEGSTIYAEQIRKAVDALVLSELKERAKSHD